MSREVVVVVANVALFRHEPCFWLQNERLLYKASCVSIPVIPKSDHFSHSDVIKTERPKLFKKD